MIRGKSLAIGSIVIAFFVLGGSSGAAAAGDESALLQAKVERRVMKMENEFGLPVDSVRCRHHQKDDDLNSSPPLKAFKCRIRYSFGADHWEWNYADASGELHWGQTVGSPWYNGDWLVDCRQTESKGFCAKLGKRQMKMCWPPTDVKYCHSLVYGNVDPRTGKAPRGADPRIISVKADAGDLGAIVNSGGCYERDGIMPPCVPDVPVTVGTGRFTTKTRTRVLTFGEVAVRASEIEPGVPGTAAVFLQLKVDGADSGPKRTVELSGEEQVTIPFERHFSMPRGSHEVAVEITGRGFDHVNVSGSSARLKVFAAKAHPRR